MLGALGCVNSTPRNEYEGRAEMKSKLKKWHMMNTRMSRAVHAEDHGLPPPSFDVDAPADLGVPKDTIAVEAARRAAVEATIELQDLLQSSTEANCTRISHILY